MTAATTTEPELPQSAAVFDNVIDRSTGTIRGRAQFVNSDGLFTPGMFACVQVPASTPYEAPPPYILVGHSLGGLYVQAYARSRPRKVAAVVLIDATTPLEPPDTFVSTVPPRAGTTAATEEAGVPGSMAALRAGPPFPPVPLIVIAASDHNDTPAREAMWQDVQAHTAMLSPRGELVSVAGGHFVQTENPQIVVTAILDAATAAGYDVAACR